MGSLQASCCFCFARFPHSSDDIVATGETRVVALHVSPHEGGDRQDLEFTVAELEHQVWIVGESGFILEDSL